MKETSKTKEKKSKKTETLEERIHRHLTDKNDVITEQDLRDVVIGVDAVNLAKPDEPTLLAEDIVPQQTITSWNLLDEKE
jgi:hypothetical protein